MSMPIGFAEITRDIAKRRDVRAALEKSRRQLAESQAALPQNSPA